MSAGMAEVIAAHQKRSMGMSGDSPDTCKCRVKVYPTDGETYIEERRDTAFAAHVAEELAKAGYGLVRTWPGPSLRRTSRTVLTARSRSPPAPLSCSSRTVGPHHPMFTKYTEVHRTPHRVLFYCPRRAHDKAY